MKKSTFLLPHKVLSQIKINPENCYNGHSKKYQTKLRVFPSVYKAIKWKNFSVFVILFPTSFPCSTTRHSTLSEIPLQLTAYTYLIKFPESLIKENKEELLFILWTWRLHTKRERLRLLVRWSVEKSSQLGTFSRSLLAEVWGGKSRNFCAFLMFIFILMSWIRILI